MTRSVQSVPLRWRFHITIQSRTVILESDQRHITEASPDSNTTRDGDEHNSSAPEPRDRKEAFQTLHHHPGPEDGWPRSYRERLKDGI